MSDTFTGETYTTLCNDAESYLAKSSPEQARELLQKAISLIGTRPRGRSLLADTCMIMELWSEAREQLEILITLEEGNVDNHFRLAQVLEELGEYQLAADNYQVVLDTDPDHHGASVAVRRITARERDSGVNLAEVFNSRVGEKAPEKEEIEEAAPEEETEEEPEPEEEPVEEEKVHREGMQIYPDVPSDELFADSEDDEDDDSVDALLKNIGLSGDSSSEDEEADVSALLENIGVSTSSALESAFGEPEDTDEPESTPPEDTAAERRKRVVSLDEIFGTASAQPVAAEEPEEEVPEEEEEPETAEEPEEEALEEEEEPVAAEEPEEEAPEEEEEPVAAEEPAEEAEEAAPFSTGRTLEDIFKETDEEPEEEAPEEEEEEEEEPVDGEEPEEEASEEEEEEEEEPVAGEEPEEEAPEEEEVTEEEAPEEEEEPVAVEEPVPEEEPAEHMVCVMRNEADYTIDPWSSESGLLTVTMISGSLELDGSMLSVKENTLEADTPEEGRVRLSGQGTFLLNCGTEVPLRLEVRENMVIRKDAVALHTGEIRLELLEIPGNEELYVVKDSGHETIIFHAPRPIRLILLGQNNRVFLVRTSSIMAVDPDIVLSGSEDGFTIVSGSGKVYLIE